MDIEYGNNTYYYMGKEFGLSQQQQKNKIKYLLRPDIERGET